MPALRLSSEPPTAVSIEVTPAEETVMAGGSVTYYATAQDADGNTWDVTADADRHSCAPYGHAPRRWAHRL